MLNRSLMALLVASAPLWPSAATAQTTELTLLRFFGGCADEYANVTDLTKAVGECGVIQVMTNKFNAENGDIRVNTQNVDWNAYYDLLSAQLASGEGPDIAVMHRSVLPNFVARDLVEPLDEHFATAGIDVNDFAPVAREAVTIEGTMYGLPFDIHALLWHLNMDVMSQAGLVNANGEPILPTSPEEFFEQARIVKERTGKRYLSMDARNDANLFRVFCLLVWQQGGNVFDENNRPTFETPEGQRALEFMDRIYGEGHAVATQGNGEATQDFLTGASAAAVTGTWSVESFADDAATGEAGFTNYAVRDFPPIFGTATWSDSHMWVLPKKQRTPEQLQAALQFLTYLNDNNLAWAKTGHLPVRTSVLESQEYANLPFRTDYAATAEIARAVPMVQNQRPAQEAMRDVFGSVLLADVSVDDALSDVQRRVERLFRRNR